MHILDWALHLDEGTPHIHERHVFDVVNKYGERQPKQEDALREMGFELPDPEKKNLTIKSDADPITVGENATVIVTGLENASGDVSVIVDGLEVEEEPGLICINGEFFVDLYSGDEELIELVKTLVNHENLYLRRAEAE